MGEYFVLHIPQCGSLLVLLLLMPVLVLVSLLLALMDVLLSLSLICSVAANDEDDDIGAVVGGGVWAAPFGPSDLIPKI